MNISLLQLVGKWGSVLVVTMASFLGNIVYTENEVIVENENELKNYSVVTTVHEHDTVTSYNSKLPSNKSNVVTEGVDGITYTDETTNEQVVVREEVTEVVEQGSGPYGEYVGRLTGYGADCYGCSAVGNVACHTKAGTNHSLVNDGMYYQDEEYGQVRILAAALSLFPCGTIILVDNGTLDPFYGVVLDTGGSMNYSWATNQEVWIDVAYVTQADARVGGPTGYNVSYSVQRWGW